MVNTNGLPLINVIKHKIFKRADRAIYAGETIKFGFYRTKRTRTKIARTWKPLFYKLQLYSQILDKRVLLRISNKALNLVDECGGLDNYILEQKTLESRRAAELKDEMIKKRLDDERKLLQ